MKPLLVVAAMLFLAIPWNATSQPDTATVTNSDSIQVILLKNQLSLMKEHQNSLLTSVYWSLGVVLAVGLLLVGYGWYVNSKSIEREKTALKAELNGNIEERFSHIEVQFLRNIQTTVDNSIELHLNTISQNIENLSGQAKQINNNLSFETTQIRIVLSSALAKRDFDQERYGGSLVQGIVMLKYALEIKQESTVGDALDYIQKSLEHLIKSDMRVLDAYLISSFTNVIDQCPASHTLTVELIKQLFQEAREKHIIGT